MAARIVGIVNVTPDSFSGDGLNCEAALARIGKILGDGADIIDLGAESTRPGATPVAQTEEWRRLRPVLEQARISFPRAVLSIDTRHARTASQALAAGADWINDVSGFSDPEMVRAVKNSSAMLVVMHALSVPPRADETLPPEADPVQAVVAFAKMRLARLEASGIARTRLIFDPGIGFGKTAPQSLALIERAGEIRSAVGMELLIGHSRKSFLRLLDKKEAEERDKATLALSRMLMAQGVDYLRVHDVAAHSKLRKSL